MIVTLISLIIISILSIVFVVYLYKGWKKKKALAPKVNPKEIPQDILEDFNKLERRFEETNGETNPYKLLWEQSMERRANRRNGTGVSQVPGRRENTSLPKQFDRREDLPSIHAPSFEQYSQEPVRSKSRNTNNFLRRIRRN